MAKAYLNIRIDPGVSPMAVTVVGIFSKPASSLPGGDYGFWATVFEVEAPFEDEAVAEVQRQLVRMGRELPLRFRSFLALYVACRNRSPLPFELRRPFALSDGEVADGYPPGAMPLG